MNTAAERQTLTADELRAAFRASRLKYTCGIADPVCAHLA
jgi:hypothetical protein